MKKVLLVISFIMLLTSTSCSKEEIAQLNGDALQNDSIDIIIKKNKALEGEIMEKNELIELLENEKAELVKQTEQLNNSMNDKVNTLLDLESKLGEATSIEEVFELYEFNLDGAIAYGYGCTLVGMYSMVDKREFVRRLALFNSEEKISGIVTSLTGSIFGLDEYEDKTIGFSEAFTTMLEEGNLSLREKQIIINILADIKGRSSAALDATTDY